MIAIEHRPVFQITAYQILKWYSFETHLYHRLSVYEYKTQQMLPLAPTDSIAVITPSIGSETNLIPFIFFLLFIAFEKTNGSNRVYDLYANRPFTATALKVFHVIALT